MAAQGKRGRGLAMLAILSLLAACQEKELILPGPRYALDTDLAAVPVDEAGQVAAAPAAPANRAVPISVPAGEANASWTQRGGNVRHVSPPGRLSAQPALVWSSPIGEGNSRRARVQASPVAGGGLVFAMDAGTQLVAVNAASGQAVWAKNMAAGFDRGGGAAGAGLAWHDSRLYVATVSGELVVLDARSGGEIWSKRLDAPAAGAPAVEGDKVFVVLRNGTALALNAADGKILWAGTGTATRSGTVGGGAPAVAGDRVVIPFESGDVSAFCCARATRSGPRAWAACGWGGPMPRCRK